MIQYVFQKYFKDNAQQYLIFDFCALAMECLCAVKDFWVPSRLSIFECSFLWFVQNLYIIFIEFIKVEIVKYQKNE